MRRFTVEQRRALLVRRHRLDGSAGGPEEVVAAMLALHATDPASVFLSVLARSRSTDLSEITRAQYDRRSLVRWMAMRRTLFVFARDDVPMVQAAVSAPLAEALRRRLHYRLGRNGLEPPPDRDLTSWLAELEAEVEAALAARGSASGGELRRDVPALAATIPPRAPSEAPQGLTSPLLTVMSTEGRVVRAAPVGAWTTRNHRWEPVSAWWPEGLPVRDRAAARAELTRRWLHRFGPATVGDLEWWTGWTKTDTRAAVAAVEPEEVDLHGEPGLHLPEAEEVPAASAPVAALLPALDPTPMGWRSRDWFTAVGPALLYDRNGNIGPTAWWDGEIVGSWAVDTRGAVRTRVVADRGSEAATAVEAAAAALQPRLGGAVVVPAIRTPLERELAAG